MEKTLSKTNLSVPNGIIIGLMVDMNMINFKSIFLLLIQIGINADLYAQVSSANETLSAELNTSRNNNKIKLYQIDDIYIGKSKLIEVVNKGGKCNLNIHNPNKIICEYQQSIFLYANIEDSVINEVHIWRNVSMPKIWFEEFNLSWSLSYNAWLSRLASLGIEIKVIEEPYINEVMDDNYNSRNSLFATLQAIDKENKIKWKLIFGYGNENGEGYSLDSKNSLHDIYLIVSN